LGIDEDPVTGSAHSQLIPLWSQRLGKKELRARQLSNRGGEVACLMKEDRIEMGGSCQFYMKGKIELKK
jgi:predicted PhzF superfamily epimerase YddE/YHI9